MTRSDWMKNAACRDADPEIFFPIGSPGTAVYRQTVQAAKAVCDTCPVTERCLSDAMAKPSLQGVWGGLEEDERRRLRRRMYRAKEAVS
ncbi:WhiB family transcriptional regulator, redox-sensing transcriptional regulator [Sinosporangium album]|uniref:Transcriptional regulator WhiB n=1 Tax=Sinosporangium album TaxID=504805 RepID=A0A1G8EHB0_9ACTN|nr:WhiB family transcriptional regulator [Sinosporangium album]SDH69314.1 WhiB family transcriptional regulator, redox-sensing transcriptional regulator [Sinosporangium album]